jgi:RNA polymerase subunit RPABC4/transcription elongation factor Spt4
MLEKVDPEVAEMLMPGEDIILVAAQSKVAPGGTLTAPNKVYITSNRVLFKDPKWFGLKANIIDIPYEDISTVILKRGVFSTEVFLKPRFSPQKIRLPAVDKKVALQVSMLIQKGMRKQPLADKPQQKSKVPVEKQNDVLARIEKLGNMREKDLLTEQEFQIMKEELMLSMKPEISPVPANAPSEQEFQPAEPKKKANAAEKRERLHSCRYCNFASVPESSKFCPECGERIVEDTNVWKMCPACDALMTGDSVFCSSCNRKFPKTLG